MTTNPTPVTEEFDYEFVAPISRFLTNLNKLQSNPKSKAQPAPDIADVFSTVMNSASKISETISSELYNIMDATDSSMKEPNFNNLIKNITDIMSTQNHTATANTSNTVIIPPAKTIPTEMFNTVYDSLARPDEPFANIDFVPNIKPPSYVDNKTTTKTIKLNKEFARDIPAMFSSKYMEFRNLNLPADHEELRNKIHNDLYNAIEQAFDISIGTLTKYTVQPYPSINELIQEHNPKIRLPASSMNELAKYLSNYSGTYNPDEKMQITCNKAKHVKLLLIDWLANHPDMYIIL